MTITVNYMVYDSSISPNTKNNIRMVYENWTPLGALPSFLEPVGNENRAAKMPEPTAESAPVDSGACKHIPGLPVQFAMGVAVSRIEKSQNFDLQQKNYRIARDFSINVCVFLPGVVCFKWT